MAKKTFEMSFQIGGKLASSFSSTFSTASSKLTSLKNEARQTQRSLDYLNNDFKKGRITQEQYSEATERLTKELSRLELAQKKTNKFKSAVSNGLSTAKSVASTAALGVAATATGVAFKSMSTAGDFQQQMAKVGTIADASESELKKLNDTALKLGASSSLSASEVAIAMGELAAKGMNSNKIIGAMPGIISAAEASGEDLALTSEVVTSALNSFGMKATEAGHVADVMAMSSNKSAAGVQDLGYSFKYAAPVAKTLGISLEELAASTGTMVDKGLSGEQAGTSLRMALIRLSNPPKEARKALDKLNISVTDSKGKFKSLTKLSDEWNKATKNLTDTQKVQYASTVFGTEAATGMLNLFSSGPKAIDDMTKSLKKSTGAADKAAKAMKDNYAGSLEQLKGSLESAQIKFASPVLPVFQDLFDGISSTIDDNLGGVEQAGQRLANGLKDVFKPFTSNDAMFTNMDFGDKVVYMLDEASAKAEAWLSGSGGESMNKIFTKLGEIAAKAWFNAFKASVTSALSNLGQGNFASAAGAGAMAWTLGGGLLAKGAFSAGKGIYNTAKGAGTAKAATVAASSSKVASAATTASATGGILKSSLGKVTPVLGKIAPTISKLAAPLAIAAEAVNVIRAKDKTRAAVSGVGGLAGGVGGAKLGAAIGTAIAPGIGTAIGSLIGSAGGYLAGKWVGGKTVDTTRQATAPLQAKATVVATTNAPTNAPANSAITKANTQLNTSVTSAITGIKKLETYAGQANTQLSTTLTDVLKKNFNTLATTANQAEGWLKSLNGIQTAGQKVETALNNLATRINNVQVVSSVGSSSKRVSYNG